MRIIKKSVQELLGATEILIPYSSPALLQECYDFGRVHLVEYREDGIYVKAELVKELRNKLHRYEIASESLTSAP